MTIKNLIKPVNLFNISVNNNVFQSNGATYPGGVDQSFGGVGRNLADGLTRLGVKTLFITAIGKDSHRAGFKAYCSHMVKHVHLEEISGDFK